MDNMLKVFNIDPIKFRLKYDVYPIKSGLDNFYLPPIVLPNYKK